MSELKIRDIIDLIAWAEESQKPLEERDVRYLGWGSWDQSQWGYEITEAENGEEASRILHEEPNVCGTAFCMAGRRVANEGYLLVFSNLEWWDQNQWVRTADDCVQGVPTGKFHKDGAPVLAPAPGAEPRDIEEFACELLGITSGEGSRFFSGSNTIRDLKQIANGLCAARGLPEPYDYDLRTGRFTLAEEYLTSA